MLNSVTVTEPVVTFVREGNGWPLESRIVFDVKGPDGASVLRVRARAGEDTTLPEQGVVIGEGDAYVPTAYQGPTVHWQARDAYMAVAETEAMAALAEARESWAEQRIRVALVAMSVPTMDGTLTLFDPEAVLAAAEQAAKATPAQRMYLSGALYGSPRM